MGDIDKDAIRARAEEVEPKAGLVDEDFYRWATQAADDRDALLDRLAVAEERARELEATVQRVGAERDEARSLIGDLYDESECWYDHHGYCQAHGWTDTSLCPHRRAAIVLGLRGSDV
ncbi:hypothetical protein [Williamsia serinedens]|uniref:Uncharacterized protein n=1 Tax=Williamsia serinedens TaxID=391736 RepID=A0ABT1H612_9NOCA|nr:hypothetical protein [Williamsia serinedens]MCP2162679.1 hypothetical protein [Williamsia serinedens]